MLNRLVMTMSLRVHKKLLTNLKTSFILYDDDDVGSRFSMMIMYILKEERKKEMI